MLFLPSLRPIPSFNQSKPPMKKLLLVLLTSGLSTVMFAQLTIEQSALDYRIDFDSTVANVNEGVFEGSGFTPSPSAGQINSNAFIANGLSDGPLAYGGTNTSGDYAKGESTGDIFSGGIYAFKTDTSSSANTFIGVQPTSSDWTPGTIGLQIKNETDSVIEEITIEYDIYFRNNESRGNDFNFAHSSDNVVYTSEAALDFTSPEASDTMGWVTAARSITITGLAVPATGSYYFQWQGDDNLGGGSRDEFGIDNIVVSVVTNASMVCGITDIEGINASSCNDNGTPTNTADDFFTTDVLITYVDAPVTGDLELRLASDSTLLASVDVTMADSSTGHTFTTLQFSADGNDIGLYARFSDDTTCSLVDLIAVTGVSSCPPTTIFSISDADSCFEINFDAVTPAVNEAQFDGSGFSPLPSGGQLNSNTFIVTGLSDGDLDFGDTGTSSDFTRGVSTGGVSGGGIYAFEVGTSDRALGVQPTSGDWTPGTIVMQIINESDSTITDLNVTYDIYVYNDGDRSNSFNFSHSDDNVTYTDEPSLDFASPETASGSPTWIATTRSIVLSGLSIDTTEVYYLRWSSTGVSGSGARDEFALDNIVLSAGGPCIDTTCNISAIIPDTALMCDDNGTPNNLDDDFFTSDIKVIFNNPLATGTLDVYVNGESMPSMTVDVSMLDSDSMHTFSAQIFAADGFDINMTAVFSDDTDCIFTDPSAINGIGPCGDIPCAMPGDLVLTEFMANPGDVSDDDGEYFEIYNRSDDTLNLFGYEVSDLGTQSFIITASVPVLPGEMVVLANDPNVPDVDYVYTDNPSEFSIGNSADELLLRCLDTVGPILITGVAYASDAPFGSGNAAELNCLDNPGPLFDENDFVPATEEFNYDADADTDFGSPGFLGNTDTSSAIATELQASAPPTIVSAGISFDLTICATDTAGIAPCVFMDYIVLEQVDGALATISNDSLPPDNACVTFDILVPMITECDTLVFDAHSDSLNLDSTVSIIVKEVVHYEDFTCNTLSWTIQNVDGFSTWECDTLGGFASANTFGDDTTTVSEDWLISPELNTTTHRELSLHFETRERFDGPPLEFLYSLDYIGSGDPNVGTWTPITFTSDASSNGFAFGPWTSSGDIDIEAISSTNIYFAFKYTGFPDDSVAHWLVDNFVISGCPKMCAIDSIVVDDIGTCDPNTNMFFADVAVHYTDAPFTGQLILSGDASDTVDVSDMSFDPEGTSFTFDSVAFTADGGFKTITASFTADSACSLTVSNVPGTDIASCAGGATVFGGLVVNEVWNDRSFSGASCFSNKAFIELLVVASLEQDTAAQFINLQNWIIEPSNDANDAGHIRIKTGCFTSIPVGALVVIYNADNVPTGIVGPDEMDADSNLVYFIPSNSSCLEYTTQAAYPGTTYEDGDSGSCTHANQLSAFASALPYGVETRHPHSFGRTYSNVYDDLNFTPSNIVTPGGSSNFTCGNIDDVANVIHDLSTTPGLANNSDNDKLIKAVREEAGNVLPLSMMSTPNPDAINYQLFLGSGLSPACDEVVPPDCVDTLIVLGPINVSDTSSASMLIETSGSVIVDGDAVFNAPEIVLNGGFEVPLGEEFITLLTGCNPASSREGSNNGTGQLQIISADALEQFLKEKQKR